MTALQPAIPLTAGDAVATVAASSALADDCPEAIRSASAI